MKAEEILLIMTFVFLGIAIIAWIIQKIKGWWNNIDTYDVTGLNDEEK